MEGHTIWASVLLAEEGRREEEKREEGRRVGYKFVSPHATGQI